MPTELRGSCLVFAICSVLHRTQRRVLLMGAFAWYMINGVTKPNSKGLSPMKVLKRIPRLSGTVTIGVLLLFILNSFGLSCRRGDPSNTPWGWGAEWACYGALEEYKFVDFLFFAWVGISDGSLLVLD